MPRHTGNRPRRLSRARRHREAIARQARATAATQRWIAMGCPPQAKPKTTVRLW
jgi:hypothetical protein